MTSIWTGLKCSHLVQKLYLIKNKILQIVCKGGNVGCQCFLLFKPLQNECFQGYSGISLSVHLSMCLSICVSIRISVCIQNTSFCQIACGGIKITFSDSFSSQCIVKVLCTEPLTHSYTMTPFDTPWERAF